MQLGSKRRALYRAGRVFLLTSVVASGAWALDDSDKEAIRTLSNEAAAEFDQGQFEAARDKFTRAYEIAKVPRLAVWIARTNERLGKLVIAYEYYRLAVRLRPNELWVGDLQTKAQHEAEQALEALTPRLGKLKIQVEGVAPEDVSVTLDGVAISSGLLGVERLVDPGSREIIGVYGKAQVKQVAALAEGGTQTVILKFVPRPKAKDEPLVGFPAGGSNSSAKGYPATAPYVPSSQPTWGWVSLGVGAAGLVGGGIAAYVTRVKYRGLRDVCEGNTCDFSHEHRVEVYRRWRMGSTAGFIVGGVMTELGVILLLTSPKAPPSGQDATTLSLWATPEQAGLEGTF